MREFETRESAVVNMIFSAVKALGYEDDENPFYSWDSLEYKNFTITGRQLDDVEWNNNFVWRSRNGVFKMDWYKYWPRSVEMNRRLDDEEFKEFFKEVLDLIEWMVKRR